MNNNFEYLKEVQAPFNTPRNSLTTTLSLPLSTHKKPYKKCDPGTCSTNQCWNLLSIRSPIFMTQCVTQHNLYVNISLWFHSLNKKKKKKSNTKVCSYPTKLSSNLQQHLSAFVMVSNDQYNPNKHILHCSAIRLTREWFLIHVVYTLMWKCNMVQVLKWIVKNVIINPGVIQKVIPASVWKQHQSHVSLLMHRHRASWFCWFSSVVNRLKEENEKQLLCENFRN